MFLFRGQITTKAIRKRDIAWRKSQTLSRTQFQRNWTNARILRSKTRNFTSKWFWNHPKFDVVECQQLRFLKRKHHLMKVTMHGYLRMHSSLKHSPHQEYEWVESHTGPWLVPYRVAWGECVCCILGRVPCGDASHLLPVRILWKQLRPKFHKTTIAMHLLVKIAERVNVSKEQGSLRSWIFLWRLNGPLHAGYPKDSL